jgi:secondary thiamine-phosphate synthase enzyme
MDSFEIRTRQRTEFIEITDQVRRVVQQARMQKGLCVVYCPHTTAAITINENADPDVVHDMLAWLNRAVPKEQPDFRHGEGNSDAHIKSSLVGASATILVDNGNLVLGRWQGVYFGEFDGPRTRTIHVQCLQDA